MERVPPRLTEQFPASWETSCHYYSYVRLHAIFEHMVLILT